MFGLISTAALFFGMLAAVAATCAYVSKVASDVNKWRKAEQARNAAVDAVTSDWIRRGLTPDGAVKEAAHYRSQVDLLISATTDSKRRIDGVEKRLATVEDQGAKTHSALRHLNDRFDDTDRLLQEAITEWRER
jgi:uncharacterized coiled-coil protein SlyX